MRGNVTPKLDEGERKDAPIPVESVRRALRVLRCFDVEHRRLGVSDIARELTMHKSTVHRLLAALESEGFVRQFDDRRYTLGWIVFELGAALKIPERVREVVLGELEALVVATGETAHLAILDEGEVLYIEKVESPYNLRMPSAVGRRVPLHCTALGKVLAAGLDPITMSRHMHTRPLEAFTLQTMTNPCDVQQEIKRVREQGFALDREEIEEGLMCVAAPVVDENGVTCAAVSIAGPTSRMSRNLDSHTMAVQTACQNISRQLGNSTAELNTVCAPRRG